MEHIRNKSHPEVRGCLETVLRSAPAGKQSDLKINKLEYMNPELTEIKTESEGGAQEIS